MKTKWSYHPENICTNSPAAELKKADNIHTHILSIYVDEYYYSPVYSEDFKRLLQYFSLDRIRVDQAVLKRVIDPSSLSNTERDELRLKVACELIEKNFREQIKNISNLIS